MGDLLINDQKPTTFEVPGMFQTSFNKLFEFLQGGILCDVVIQVGNKSLKCHRTVLASVSPYFQAMFTTALKEKDQSVITIHDIDGNIMELLIKFAYTAKIDLNIANVQSLLHASSILQLESLAEVCCHFMFSQLHPSNCLGIRELAHRFGQEELVKKADAFIQNNFLEISNEDEFVSISAKQLEDILSTDNLFVENETEVCMALLRWMEHDVENRTDSFAKLLLHVHLPFLSMELIHFIEDQPFACRNFECRDLLNEARDFRLEQMTCSPTRFFPKNKRAKPRKSYAGAIFCIGGRGMNGNPFSSNELFSSFHNQWVKLQEMSTCRRHVGCTSNEGKIYAVGGCNNEGHLSTAEVYDAKTNEWRELAPMSTPRRGLGVCATEGAIYAVGGLDNTLFYSIVERYDINSNVWSTVSSMKCARGGVAVVELKGIMYALGGNSGSVSLNTCEAYNARLDKWLPLPPMNQCRAGAGAVELNGYIYMIGGFENNVSLSSVERYDPSKRQWSFVSSMKVRRGGVSAAVLGGHIYAIGGHNATHYLNTVEIYDAENDTWTFGPNISDYRAGAGVTWCYIGASDLKRLINKVSSD